MMSHPNDGERPGDVCRHRWVDLQLDGSWVHWLCAACELEWWSIPEPGFKARICHLFPGLMP